MRRQPHLSSDKYIIRSLNFQNIAERQFQAAFIQGAAGETRGPVKLIEWVKIALLFLHVTSKLFQFTILNLSG